MKAQNPQADVQWVHTIAELSQLEATFKGDFLKGHAQPRVAIVGRSNVGKSSLLNSLLKTKLARVSTQPGKTRAIYFYLWKSFDLIVADMPGYGYAKASKHERNRWEAFIQAYIDNDPCLERAILLLDSRHGPSETDLDALRFLRDEKVAVTIVMTKSDQLKTQSIRAQRRKEVEKTLQEYGIDGKSVYWVSSLKKEGFLPLLHFLREDKHRRESERE